MTRGRRRLADLLYKDTVTAPIGSLTVIVDGLGRLVRIRFTDDGSEAATSDQGLCSAVVTQLEQYFSGTRQNFEIELAVRGTEFQRRVWNEVSSIPFGECVSYGEVARRLGDPGAVRAVGAANGANPVPIVIPCHRVIGSDGTLVGYRGGLNIKAALLRHEGSLEIAEQPRLDFGY